MTILSAKIDQYCRDYLNRHDLGLVLIFSDASVPSEGEHKILQYLKTQPLDKNCIIYGLDSDLIMLSMCAKRSNVALIRENNFLKNNNIDLAIDKYPQLDYFLVDQLKHILFATLISNQEIRATTNFVYDQAIKSPYQIDRVIADYIFMSFLLGNDFIPAFPSLTIRDGGIEQIIMAYRATLPQGYCVNADLTLNLPCLLAFLQVLARKEEATLINIKCQRDKRIKFRSQAPPVTYEEALDHYPRIEHLCPDDINVQQTGWQLRYYHHFHLGGRSPHSPPAPTQHTQHTAPPPTASPAPTQHTTPPHTTPPPTTSPAPTQHTTPPPTAPVPHTLAPL